jgi:hypothetical protein
MTRSISAENFAAIQARRLVPRDFIWLIARDRTSGAPVAEGVWSGQGTFNAAVLDPHTGGSQERQFFGSGSLVSVGDITLVQGITVQNLTITLSGVDAGVNDYVRTYDLKQAEIQIFRGFLDPDTRLLVAPATPRFVGFIDDAPITTAKENNPGSITITATSNTQELTRANSDTRSDASQRLRSATDNFYQDTAVVGTWQIFWGQASGPVVSPDQQLRNAVTQMVQSGKLFL